MSNTCVRVTGGLSGYVAGSVGSFYLKATAGTIAAGAIGGGVPLLTALPFFVGLVPAYYLAKQISYKYADSPLKLLTAHFLLASSFVVLTQMINIAITAAFVASLNPFTLPIMLAAGASACVLLGLFLISREPSPVRAFTHCISNFFNSISSSKKENEVPVETTNREYESYVAPPQAP